jgi:cobalt-zinc-cadmium efflux system outer membrane protein
MQIRNRGAWRRGIAVVAWIATIVAWVAATVAPSTAETPGDLPSGTVSLAVAVDAALAHDPSLAAHDFERDARAARVRQEGRLPNPSLATEVENVAVTGGDSGEVDEAQTTITLTQPVELTGKRGRRVDVARADERLAERDLERARLDVAARVRKAFATGWLAQARVDLAARLRDLARGSVRAARRQLDAGGGSSIEVARAEASLATAEAAVTRREREARAARAALAATWGGGDDSVTRLAGGLAPLPRPRPLVELQDALAADPDLARFDDALARGEADVALEEARRVPDLAVRVGARRFARSESNALVAELSMPIPVFDRNTDAVAEARARVGKVGAERRAAHVAKEQAVRAEYAELEAAYDEAQALDAAVLPRVRAALAETRRGYDAGRLRYLEVLEAERAIAETEEEYLSALARFHTTAAELSRLVGASAVTETGGVR